MGELFVGSPDYPDYVAMPSFWFEMVRVGALPTLISAICVTVIAQERSVPTIAPVLTVTQRTEPPHTHQEAFDEPLRPVDFRAAAGSTSGSVPFIPFDNSANEMIIRNANARRQRAVWMSTMSWSSPVWVEEST